MTQATQDAYRRGHGLGPVLDVDEQHVLIQVNTRGNTICLTWDELRGRPSYADLTHQAEQLAHQRATENQCNT